MKIKTKQFVNKVGTDSSGKWIYYDRMDDLVSLVVEECILAVEKAKVSLVGTTYDKAILDTAKASAILEIKNAFKE